MNTSWCDKLASTGTVGIRMSPKFRPTARTLEAISPLLDTQVTPRSRGERVTFSVDRSDAYDLVVTLRDGIRFAFTPQSMSVGFVHRAEALPRSAGAPTLQFTSTLEPFSVSIPKLARNLARMFELLDEKDRSVVQIGIVADTAVALEDAPPGLADLIQSTVHSWGESISFSFQIVSKIFEDESRLERCIHTVAKPEDTDAVPTINLDWQRLLKTPKSSLRPSALNALVDECAESAVAYFELLAEGVDNV